MVQFKRGISNPFVAALKELAVTAGWWRDVLSDPSLLIAVRNEYLNVYWYGQSIFKITRPSGRVTASTHPKYLLDPDLSKLVSFDGKLFSVDELRRTGFIEKYDAKTLSKLKRSAERYAVGEKIGVHSIWNGNPAVIDVEIDFSVGGQKGRADVATFEPVGDSVKLVFWEAKLFSNKELRASPGREVPVLGQIKKYRQILKNISGVLESYRQVASNQVALAEMSGGNRKPSKTILAVAKTPSKLEMSDPVDFGLLIYDFDEPQRKAFGSHLERLTADLGKVRVRSKGSVRGLQI
jgi:hypothetical protein